MSEDGCYNYLDGEFYHVETINGKKMIHVNGYYYDSEDGTKYHYRFLEFHGAYLDPDQLRRDRGWDESDFEGGMLDLTEHDLIRKISNDTEDVVVLEMKKVTEDTPEGWYHSPC